MNGPAPTGGILLGKYRIERIVGDHAVGVVRTGLDLRFDRPVLLYVVDAPIERRRFQREARLIAQVRHPALSGVIDHGALPDGRAVVVCERPAGVPLARWLPGASADDARDVLGALLAGLTHAHAAGLVHGGIRPGAIYIDVTADGVRPTLHELGLARLSAKAEGLSGEFAAPEGPPWTAATDRYALARTFRRLSAELPPPLGPPLAPAPAPDPAQRPADAARWFTALGLPAPAPHPAPAPPALISIDATALQGMSSQPPADVAPVDGAPAGARPQDRPSAGRTQPSAAPWQHDTLVDEPSEPGPERPTGEGPASVQVDPSLHPYDGLTHADGPLGKRDAQVRLSAEQLQAALAGPARADRSTTAPILPRQPDHATTLQLAAVRRHAAPARWPMVLVALAGAAALLWLWAR